VCTQGVRRPATPSHSTPFALYAPSGAPRGQGAKGGAPEAVTLHGNDMPGLTELAQAAERVTIDYTELPDGARLTFTTSESYLVTAFHRWFGAQLSDHASDATYR